MAVAESAPDGVANPAVERLWRRLRSSSSRPSLAQLGRAKLLRLSIGGGQLAAASLVMQLILHHPRLGGIRQGTFRGGAARVLRWAAAAVLVPSSAITLLCLVVLVLAWRRRKADQDQLHLWTALEALGRDLHAWAQGSKHLRTYSAPGVGWLAAQAPPELLDQRTPDLTGEFRLMLRKLRRQTRQRGVTGRIQRLAARLGMIRAPVLSRKQMLDALGPPAVAGGWDGLTVLLIPGLLTQHYPGYFVSILRDLNRLGIDTVLSGINTGGGVQQNAEVIFNEVQRITKTGRRHPASDLGSDTTGTDTASGAPDRLTRRVVLYGHSKGAVDAAAAMAMFPEMIPWVAALVSAQGPHAGSWVANDLSFTQYQKSIATFAVERALGGSRDAVFDLVYEKRQEFIKAFPRRVWTEVPSICLVTSGCQLPEAILSPIVEYMRYRYGEELGVCDGLVAVRDAVLPGSPVVRLHDMDHFGPAWTGFPAKDRYNATYMLLSLIMLALNPTNPSSNDAP